GSLTSAASQDYSSVSVRGLSEFFPKLVDLLADVVINPSLPADEIAILKQQHLQTAAQNTSSPQYVANRTFRSALFGNHPYSRTSETAATIGAIDRAKLEAFHAQRYRPGNAFVLVVGAVEPDVAFATVEKAFGSWAKGDMSAPKFTAAP